MSNNDLGFVFEPAHPPVPNTGKKIACVFSGAGLSRESGLQTFRDSDGLWENHKVEEVASREGWEANVPLVLDFYAARTRQMRTVEPNAGHKALARLEEKYEVYHLTQNIDDLLERAGCCHVWHLHGDINHRKCEHHFSSGHIPDAGGPCNYRCEQAEPVTLEDKCPLCNGQMRPDVTWFGEAVNMRDRELAEIVPRCDVFIGVGTSALVHPAATVLQLFVTAKQKYFVDPKPAPRLRSYSRLEGTAGELLPPLVDFLLTTA